MLCGHGSSSSIWGQSRHAVERRGGEGAGVDLWMRGGGGPLNTKRGVVLRASVKDRRRKGKIYFLNLVKSSKVSFN
jgi:hypothetical protein